MGPCALPKVAGRAESCRCEPHGPLIVAHGDECIRCGRMPGVTVTDLELRIEAARQRSRQRQKRGMTKRNRKQRRVVIEDAA